MCGVVAAYAYHPAGPPIDPEEVVRVRDRMQRRGPDGEGLWRSADGRVALGHRRLSIIDLDERAAQPMVAAFGAAVLSFNGEIYNYRQLRAELAYPFRTTSDTEALLALYAEVGDDLFRRLRGMYAFALWDDRRGALLLARDPYGIKPLYYTDDGRTVWAASQVRALARPHPRLDPAGLAGFMLLGSVPEPHTIEEGTRAVPAGTAIWVDEAGVHEPRAHASVPALIARASHAPLTITPNERQRQVRQALLDAVTHHLVADVPVGAFLSAGIDSGTLVALMHQLGQQDIRTVTVTFEEHRGHPHDEAPLAELVAARYGTRHETVVITRQDFYADLPRLLSAMDQPSVDGVNTWLVSKATRQSGLKVALSGVGGDELFGGYASFRDLPRLVRLLRPAARVPSLGRAFRRLYDALAPDGERWRPKLAGLLSFGGTYPGAYFLRRGLFMPWELPALLGEELAREGLARLAPLEVIGQALHPAPGTAFATVASLEAALYLKNQLLRDADWASMDSSLELRTPLVDHTLLGAVAPVVAGSRSRGKRLLARSADLPLPDELMRRPKTGFSVPIGRWLEQRGDLDAWRRVPLLRRPQCHWSRRLAYALAQPYLAL